MAIKATVDNTEYKNIDTITAGGKTVSLAEIGTISTPTGAKSITSNGTYDVTEFASAEVNVPTEGASATLTTKTITANGTYNASAEGADGFSSVIVNIASGGGDLPPWFELVEEGTLEEAYSNSPSIDDAIPYLKTLINKAAFEPTHFYFIQFNNTLASGAYKRLAFERVSEAYANILSVDTYDENGKMMYTYNYNSGTGTASASRLASTGAGTTYKMYKLSIYTA